MRKQPQVLDASPMFFFPVKRSLFLLDMCAGMTSYFIACRDFSLHAAVLERFADVFQQLIEYRFVLPQESASGVVTAAEFCLTNRIRSSRGLLHEAELLAERERLAFARDSFAVEHVEFGLTELSCDFILDNFHAMAAADGFIALLICAIRRISIRTEV